MTRNGNKGKRKKWHRRKGQLFFGTLLVVSLTFIFIYNARLERARDLYGKLQAEQNEAAMLGVGENAVIDVQALRQMQEELAVKEPAETDAFPHLENAVDFAALQESNEDVYAWIVVPGTQVDYPVLQHPTDDAYYLNHTLEGAAGRPGAIYSEQVHPKDFTAVHTVLYGHNMRDGTMFASLHDYEDPDFFAEHPYVYIHLPERTLVYRIYAAVEFSDAYLPIYRDYKEEAEFLDYVRELKSSPGQVNEEVEVPYGSRLLTLSTCVQNAAKKRFLVSAVFAGEYKR